MKYIKRFENIENTPKIGDYVILDLEIGQLIDEDNNWWYINFEKNQFLTCYYTKDYIKERVKYWSKNKQELETILVINKYNL